MGTEGKGDLRSPFPPLHSLKFPPVSGNMWERIGNIRERGNGKGLTTEPEKPRNGGPAELKRPGVVGPEKPWSGRCLPGPEPRKEIWPLVYFFPALGSNIRDPVGRVAVGLIESLLPLGRRVGKSPTPQRERFLRPGYRNGCDYVGEKQRRKAAYCARRRPDSPG